MKVNHIEMLTLAMTESTAGIVARRAYRNCTAERKNVTLVQMLDDDRVFECRAMLTSVPTERKVVIRKHYPNAKTTDTGEILAIVILGVDA